MNDPTRYCPCCGKQAADLLDGDWDYVSSTEGSRTEDYECEECDSAWTVSWWFTLDNMEVEIEEDYFNKDDDDE